MAGKLSPRARAKLASLHTLSELVQSAYSQVERYAGTRDPRHAEMLTQPLKRTFGKLKLEMMGAGFDGMSQLAASMEIAAGRNASQRRKTHILREGVGSLRFQLEMEERNIVSQDATAQAETDTPADDDG